MTWLWFGSNFSVDELYNINFSSHVHHVNKMFWRWKYLIIWWFDNLIIWWFVIQFCKYTVRNIFAFFFHLEDFNLAVQYVSSFFSCFNDLFWYFSTKVLSDLLYIMIFPLVFGPFLKKQSFNRGFSNEPFGLQETNITRLALYFYFIWFSFL